ncbi:MAG: PfkB family carbohydrate kinase [Promethearchaeia archaeon]
MSKEPKRKTSILFIGHIAIDNVIKNKIEFNPTLGGSVCFCSLALNTYTSHVTIGVLSKLGKNNFPPSLLKRLNSSGINLEGIIQIDSDNTNFVLDYSNNYRKLTLKSRSPDIHFEDMPKRYLENKPDAIVLVPICNEISFEFVRKIHKTFPNACIGIDLQGFVRTIDKEGNVLLDSNGEKKKIILKIIELLGDRLICKGSKKEMQYVSGKREMKEIMNFYRKFEGISIMTLGKDGSLITQKDHEIIEIPAYRPEISIDETGAGDVYLSIFIYEYLKSTKEWDTIKKIGKLAASAASFLIEEKGVAGFKPKKIIKKRIKRKNYYFLN